MKQTYLVMEAFMIVLSILIITYIFSPPLQTIVHEAGHVVACGQIGSIKSITIKFDEGLVVCNVPAMADKTFLAFSGIIAEIILAILLILILPVSVAGGFIWFNVGLRLYFGSYNMDLGNTLLSHYPFNLIFLIVGIIILIISFHVNYVFIRKELNGNAKRKK